MLFYDILIVLKWLGHKPNTCDSCVSKNLSLQTHCQLKMMFVMLFACKWEGLCLSKFVSRLFDWSLHLKYKFVEQTTFLDHFLGDSVMDCLTQSLIDYYLLVNNYFQNAYYFHYQLLSSRWMEISLSESFWYNAM